VSGQARSGRRRPRLDERERGRERAIGELGLDAVAEAHGGGTESIDEGAVCVPECFTYGFGGGMNQGGGTGVRGGRRAVGILLEDATSAQDGGLAGSFSVGFHRALLVLHELSHESPILIGRLVGKGGELAEMNGVDPFGPQRVGSVATPASFKLRGPIEPDATKRRSADEGGSRRGPGPTVSPVHEPFLQTLAQNVSQASRLAVTISDDDGAVAAGPERAPPPMTASDLLGDIGEDVLHESGKLVSVVDTEECVHMVAQDGEGEDTDAVEFLGTSDDPEDEVIGGWIRAKQEPASDRSGSHFDHRTRGDVPERTWHSTCIGPLPPSVAESTAP
jgi:hypothetical protein